MAILTFFVFLDKRFCNQTLLNIVHRRHSDLCQLPVGKAAALENDSESIRGRRVRLVWVNGIGDELVRPLALVVPLGFVTLMKVRAKNRNKSKIRSRMEHVFGVVKRLWEFDKVRYRSLQEYATRACTALALANIYLGRQRLRVQVRP